MISATSISFLFIKYTVSSRLCELVLNYSLFVLVLHLSWSCFRFEVCNLERSESWGERMVGR
jgi:hypothetical protein